MGVAYVFSKIQPKATIIATIALVFVALALYLVPGLGLIFALFATIPGIVLWNKSIQSFGISALITVIITTVLGNTFVLSAIILVLIASLIIGQLLKERTSKERILYVTTVAMSLISLIAFMLLQTFGRIPPSASIVKPFKQTLHEAITMSGADANMTQILEEGFRQATVQLPGFIIIITFLIVLINLIATPVFKPLFAWQMSGILLWIYIIVIICLLFTGQPSVFQSILLNFQLVLSLVMYIQGLSVIHFFGKAKGLPNAVTILLLVIGTILTPTTHIVGLLGVIDLSLNLKRIMKNNSKK
ncbi:TPA: YybS family protein [Staphylococcus aureus]